MTKINDGTRDDTKEGLCSAGLLDKYQQGYTASSPTAPDSTIDLGDACTLMSSFDGATIESPMFGEFCSGTGEQLYSNGCGKFYAFIVNGSRRQYLIYLTIVRNFNLYSNITMGCAPSVE